jgi:TolB-like protein
MSLPAALVLVLCSAAAEKPKLVVLELAPGSGVEPSLTGPLTEAVTTEVQRAAFFEVISSRDIQSLLGIERQKQLLGCGEEAKSCMAELSGALGARFVMTGTVARLGEAWQLTLTTLDSQKAQPLGRATRLARSVESLRSMLPYAVAEATGTPLPAPPSRTLPWTLVGVGAGAAVFGLVWGVLHLSQEQQLGSVLDAAAGTPGILGTRTSYEAQLRVLETQRWVAVGALVAGAASLITGLVLMPGDGNSASLALVPTFNGLGLAGNFP